MKKTFVAALAALSDREVGALQRRPQHHAGGRVLFPHGFDMGQHPVEVQRADVFDKVQRVGMVGRVRSDRVGIVIDARDHLGARISAVPRKVYPGRGAARTAEQVDVQKSDFIV